jgi:hypothetical protein
MNSPQLGPYMTRGQAATVGNYKFEFPRDWGAEGGCVVQGRERREEVRNSFVIRILEFSPQVPDPDTSWTMDTRFFKACFRKKKYRIMYMKFLDLGHEQVPTDVETIYFYSF